MPTTKTNQTHTPGPWTSHSARRISKTEPGYFAMVQAAEGTRAPAKGYGMMPETAEANAHLIAAAPDLLEAAKDALIELESVGAALELAGMGVPDHNFKSRGMLRAAIAKAEGR